MQQEGHFTIDMSAVDQAMLTPLVRQALESRTIEVTGWNLEEPHVGLMGADVYRLSGTGRDQGTTVPWSIVLKVVRSNGGREGWKREPLAFGSGLLEALPGGLTAPRCFDIVERSHDEVWIWLEEIRGQPGTEWPCERYVLGARHLGQFNGAYLARGHLPSAPWLMKDMLRRWNTHLAPSVEQLRKGLEQVHPLLRRGWPSDVAASLFRLWAERGTFSDALTRLPQTFCHHDANGRNLIARDTAEHNQTVALDWDLAGIGPPGYDIVPLCGELLPDFRFELSEARDLVEGIFEGYLAGLRDAGWRGNRGVARFGFTTTLALRYGVCGGPANLSDLLDETRHTVPEQRWGRTIGEVMDRWAAGSRFMLGLANEARELLNRLS